MQGSDWATVLFGMPVEAPVVGGIYVQRLSTLLALSDTAPTLF